MTQALNQDTFRYSFVDTQPNTVFTYYTMAVYAWSYGLTDQRKPEYRLNLTIRSALSEGKIHYLETEEGAIIDESPRVIEAVE